MQADTSSDKPTRSTSIATTWPLASTWTWVTSLPNIAGCFWRPRAKHARPWIPRFASFGSASPHAIVSELASSEDVVNAPADEASSAVASTPVASRCTRAPTRGSASDSRCATELQAPNAVAASARTTTRTTNRVDKSWLEEEKMAIPSDYHPEFAVGTERVNDRIKD